MRFNDDMIRRRDLPRDVMNLIHDLAYHHEGRGQTAVDGYVLAAQEILKLGGNRPVLAVALTTVLANHGYIKDDRDLLDIEALFEGEIGRREQ